MKLSWFLALLAAVALPLYAVRFHIFGLPTTLLELLILAAVASAAIEQLSGNQRLRLGHRPRRLLQLGWLLTMAALASALYSPTPLAGLGLWRAYFLEPVLLAWLVLVQISRRSETQRAAAVRQMLGALIIGGTAVAAYAVYQHFTGSGIPAPWQPEATRRVTSWLGYPNAVGLLLAPLIPLALGLFISKAYPHATAPLTWRWVEEGVTKRWRYLPLVALMALAVWRARSEGALVGTLAGLGLFGLLYSQRSRRVVTIALVMVAALTVAVAPLRRYVVSAVTLNDCPVLYECSLSLRRLQWAETWQYLTSSRLNLVAGAGLAGYQTAIAPYHTKQGIEVYLYPHNVLLNFWVEIGLVGLLLFLAVVVYVVRAGLAYLRQTNGPNRALIVAALASLTVSLVHGLVDVPYFKNDLAVLFWLTAIVPFAIAGHPQHRSP